MLSLPLKGDIGGEVSFELPNLIVYFFFCASLGAQLGTGDGQTVGVQTCALGDSHAGTSGIQQQGITGVLVCRGSPGSHNYGKKKTKQKYKMDEFLVAAAVYNLELALFLFLKHKNYVLE